MNCIEGFTMDFLDYTGKLNEHKDYLRILKALENKCKFIEYVLIDDEDIEFIEKFKDYVISSEYKNKWWGTKSSDKYKVYKLNSSKELFKYLMLFETFCKYSISDKGDKVQNIDFGINDIAFFDDKEMPLLYTTTHEGYITIRDDLL